MLYVIKKNTSSKEIINKLNENNNIKFVSLMGN